eukprot:Protomagalhaensia_sp_Gyna_25__5304@NODE_662_length_2894_cov_93_294221_g517_i0_p2_GENE_NODE_662_length_2894_cov_93_294221_g517_i0NODE_662_length_2894_cov_93_294221_g517_i0_p2_ORF_typecomplete_len274_score30_43Ubox/PF04564_15/1_8e15zfNse/PF11789_8/1_9e07zfNOSIP/PF15906_5/0_054Rtf2/PF04641_12/0_051zfC3HC4_2/PF13923_6/0_069_NODE_662_length_2894_cov_93_294221_g517_i06661487
MSWIKYARIGLSVAIPLCTLLYEILQERNQNSKKETGYSPAEPPQKDASTQTDPSISLRSDFIRRSGPLKSADWRYSTEKKVFLAYLTKAFRGINFEGTESKVNFACPITKDVFVNPVVAADGYTYEAEAIMDWLKRSNISPVTGIRLQSLQLMPDSLLADILRIQKSKFRSLWVRAMLMISKLMRIIIWSILELCQEVFGKLGGFLLSERIDSQTGVQQWDFASQPRGPSIIQTCARSEEFSFKKWISKKWNSNKWIFSKKNDDDWTRRGEW